MGRSPPTEMKLCLAQLSSKALRRKQNSKIRNSFKNRNVECILASCCCSVAQCDPKDCSTPGLPVPRYLPELGQVHVHWIVVPPNHLILCHPPLLLPSVFPSIRVFSNKLPLSIRWPKYWSFSFNISPPNEYSGFISFGIDWLDLLAVQGTLKSLLQCHDLKASIPCCIWRILNGMCLSVASIIHSIKCSKIIKNQKINIEKKEIL